MIAFLLTMLTLALVGLMSSFYLWVNTEGVKHHAMIALEVGFGIGIVYSVGVLLDFWPFSIAPVVLLVIMGITSMYVGILAVEHFVKKCILRAEEQLEMEYSEQLNKADAHDRRSVPRL